FYDPLLAKVITWGVNRDESLQKMICALEETIVLGVTTNISYLLDVLRHPAFAAGRISTRFLEEEFGEWSPPPADDHRLWLALAALESNFGGRPVETAPDGLAADPWSQPSGWRNVAA
ncbi:MAG: 3-methylcrotonyl-CoA carboxylase, partial [Candidatus Promineifilaceae bacterium]